MIILVVVAALIVVMVAVVLVVAVVVAIISVLVFEVNENLKFMEFYVTLPCHVTCITISRARNVSVCLTF